MMKIKIEVDCDNAAWEENPVKQITMTSAQIAWAMKCILFDKGVEEKPLLDSNDKKIGKVWKESESDE